MGGWSERTGRGRAGGQIREGGAESARGGQKQGHGRGGEGGGVEDGVVGWVVSTCETGVQRRGDGMNGKREESKGERAASGSERRGRDEKQASLTAEGQAGRERRGNWGEGSSDEM